MSEQKIDLRTQAVFDSLIQSNTELTVRAANLSGEIAVLKAKIEGLETVVSEKEKE